MIGILTMLCALAPEQIPPVMPLITGWQTTRIQEEPAGSPYDWGPSVMFDEDAGVYRMWWCRLGGDRERTFTMDATFADGTVQPFKYPNYADRIYYAESRDGKTWSITGPDCQDAPEDYGPDSQGPLMVLGPAETIEQFYHVGRPAVVKVEGVFYMYYEAPGACILHQNELGERTGATEYHNQVFLAVSQDGKRWQRYPDHANPIPVIPAPPVNKTPGHMRYGLGQPSVYHRDGRFIMHYVDSCTGPGDFMVRIEADNPYFRNATLFHDTLSGAEGIPQGAVSRHAQTQIRPLGDTEYLIRPAYGTGRLGLLASGSGVFDPDSRVAHPAEAFPQITCPDPRDGTFLERLFPTFLTDASGNIRIENGHAVVFYSTGGGFKDVCDTWDLARCEITQEDLTRAGSMQRCIGDLYPEPHALHIPSPIAEADFERLPRFYSSDAAYDAFVNEYFMRYLSVDERGIYLGGGPILGAVDHMWVLEWDWWLFPWIDRGAMGLWRQSGSPEDVIRTTLLHVPVDRHGYTWGARLHGEAKDRTLSHAPLFGWPWPKYDRNYTVSQPTGWEFNTIDDGMRDQWSAEDIELEPGYSDYCLAGRITGPAPALISPTFEVDAFHVPLIELDLIYSVPEEKDARTYIDGFRLYWETVDAPGFSEDRMVEIGDSSLPPAQFPEPYVPLAKQDIARYPLYYAMHLHPEWGRGGQRITRLKLVPTGPNAEGVRIALNYLRANYDTRLTTTNATLINATSAFYLWSGDDAYLAMQLPRMRRALMFLNHHLCGKEKGLLEQTWMVGKDGMGGETGHGLYGNYWDLLPGGVVDIESNLNYYRALRMMAEMERVAHRKGLSVEPAQVVGPDNTSILTYDETPESLEALAAVVKKAIEETFWVPETGRFAKNRDIQGTLHDYGYLHFNVMASAFGIGTPEQKDSILSWLNGRVIPGDTASGADIYHWRFSPRITTRRNDDWYYWAWIWERERAPENPAFAWGNQMQDGGAVSFTSLFDLMLRCSAGRQEETDGAFQRTREIQAWFEDVKAAGGEGRDFYRAYYDGHPERGLQQSPMPGGLGLDREFLSDGSMGIAFPVYGFLGMRSEEENVLDIAPAVPSELEHVGVANLFYRGCHLTVEAGHDYLSLIDSAIPNASGLSVRIRFRNLPETKTAWIDNTQVSDTIRQGEDLIFTIPLAPVRVDIR